MLETDFVRKLWEEYTDHIAIARDYFKELYYGVEGMYPSVAEFISKTKKSKDSEVINLIRSIGIDVKEAGFWEKHFYMIVKGNSYFYEFADLGLKDIKELMKDDYENCLTNRGVKYLVDVLKKRKSILPMEALQEYTGKIRSKNTLKKEKTLISSKELYYLYPFMDRLWEEHGFDKIASEGSEAMKGSRLINIRGTNGSGKTTMMKGILSKLNSIEEGVWEEFTVFEPTRLLREKTRKVQIWHKQRFIVLGIYNDKQTGGVDNYDTPWQMMYAIFFFMNKYKGYTVLFEGIRVSTNFVYWNRMFSMLNYVGVRTDAIGLTFDNPRIFLDNVIKRREGKGLPELKNTEEIIDNNRRAVFQILMFMSQGFNSYLIKGDNGAEESLKILQGIINLEV